MGFRWFKLIITIITLIIVASNLQAQSDNVYLDMTLEELFDVDVMVSASKRAEDLFEAPLSVTVIKQQEIINSGATSIPEALRLAPGLIVREQSPGNFDVHIRGFDDVTTSFMTPHPTNTIMLVMIDNRIVYNYFSGGTFWETLPVSINDISKIEVVRGPASALYGPNAATGVINIITKFADKPGLSSSASVSAGSNQSQIANMSLGYRCNKTAVGLSGNFTSRDRVDDLYYDWVERKYVPIQEMSTFMFQGVNPETGQPYRLYESEFSPGYNVDRALNKYGMNSFFVHNFNDYTSITTEAGFQGSTSQKTFYNNFSTPFSEYHSKSWYGDIVARHKGLYFQTSFQQGKHDNNFFWNAYEFSNLDVITEYQFDINNIHIRPGLSYRRSDYKGLLISNEPLGNDIHQKPTSNRVMESTSLSMLAEYMLANQVRFIGGVRIDDYNINDNYSFTYESAITYRLNKNNLLRMVYAKANRAPFMIDSFIGEYVEIIAWVGEFPIGMPVIINFNPNRNVDYLSNRTLEMGWRSKFKKMELDMQVFWANLDDFLDMPTTSFDIDSVKYGQKILVENIEYNNIEYKSAHQYGSSVTLTYQPNPKLNVKLYGMFQDTQVNWNKEELIRYNTLLNQEFEQLLGFENVTPAQLDSIVDQVTKDVRGSTPQWYGGFVVNYQPVDRLNLNFNGYYSGSQNFVGVDISEDYYVNIDPYVVLNFKGSYRFWKKMSAFVNVRNLLGKHREYAFTDRIYNTVLMGLELAP